MVIKESLKDFIKNTFLAFWNYIKIKILDKKFGQCEPDTQDMTLVFEEFFTKFDDKVWRVGQPWGKFHPDSPHQYYGDSSVYIENEHLILDQKYLPTELKNWDSNRIYSIPHSVGLVTSKESYGYGFYQFKVRLPKGVGLWPAVWLTCDKTWPPEIDINESYSNEKGVYRGKLESNFHFDFDKNKKSSGARSHFVYNTDRVILMSCWWTKDFIKIYYNGHLVRQITSEKTMKWFRDVKMIIVLNNAVRPEFSHLVNEQTSKFHIYSVKYFTN